MPKTEKQIAQEIADRLAAEHRRGPNMGLAVYYINKWYGTNAPCLGQEMFAEAEAELAKKAERARKKAAKQAEKPFTAREEHYGKLAEASLTERGQTT